MSGVGSGAPTRPEAVGAPADRAPAARERGGVGVLLLLPLVVAAAVVLAVATAAGSVLLAAGRAADLADEAAIATVHSSLDGRARPCEAARAVVAEPGTRWDARLVSCAAGPEGATTIVAVRVASPLARRLGVAHRSASAAAAIAP